MVPSPSCPSAFAPQQTTGPARRSAQAKLDANIQAMTGRPNPATVAEREALAREIAHLETQLRTHAAKLDSLAPGRGVVAREGFPEVHVQTNNIGEGLESFVEKLRNPDGTHTALGGTFRITTPEIQGKNVARELSIELELNRA